MSKTRTIEWASVAGWAAENEQQIHGVMKFEGLKGAMVEVLRLAPVQPELAALREELEKLKQVTNFSDAVACVFDFLKTAAANTGCREWDDRLEDLAQDAIEYAPEYKKQWQDICKLQQRLADAERRNSDLVEVLREVQKAARKQAWANGYPTLFANVDAALTKPEEAKS